MTRVRSKVGIALFLAAAVLAAGGSVRAFTPRTRAFVVHRALALLPPALARQLLRHEDALVEGALADWAREAEGRGAHALDPGTADEELVRRIDEAISLLDRRAPMREVARAFGRIAHAVADLSFALDVGPDDPREASFYEDFARYVEDQASRVRLVFPGWAEPHLARDDVRGFARAIAARARRDYEGILRSYHPEGRDPLPQDFDERSIAFAAASLELSLAVTATAQAFLYAWYRAHGDLAGAHGLGTHPRGNPFALPGEETDR